MASGLSLAGGFVDPLVPWVEVEALEVESPMCFLPWTMKTILICCDAEYVCVCVFLASVQLAVFVTSLWSMLLLFEIVG